MGIKTKEVCPLGLTFFGLPSKYFVDVYEQIFFLVFKGNFSFSEVYNFPINLRNWFAQRFIKFHDNLEE